MIDDWMWWLLPIGLLPMWWRRSRRGRPPRDAGRMDAPWPPLPPLPPTSPDDPPAQETRRVAEAAQVADAVLRGARESARRELALRNAAAAQAAAEAAERLQTERDAAARTQAQRLAAELAARARADLAAAEAQRRAAETERRRRPPEAPKPPDPAPPPPARRPEDTLVMVVGDSKHLRAKTGRALAARRFQVVLAEDGPRALALLAVRPPQVLITDVEMPGLDGLALTRTLRADPKAATLPVLMVSWPDEWLKTEAAEAGVTVLMTKPCADDELIAQVARLAGVALSE